MNITDAYQKIDHVRQNLATMQTICGSITYGEDGEYFHNNTQIANHHDMSVVSPDDDKRLQEQWLDLQQNVPPGFSVDGNLIRHMRFNMSSDWVDISKRDVPRELTKVTEYRKRLSLVEYLNQLHPDVSRVTETVLSGDIDAALKTVYASLDVKVRAYLHSRAGTSTVPEIGRGFREGLLVAPQPENNDAARNFLQGVLGYYRSNLLHLPLPTSRNSIEASLSFFALAHETLKLFDSCCVTETE